jgi:hypothetical protein
MGFSALLPIQFWKSKHVQVDGVVGPVHKTVANFDIKPNVIVIHVGNWGQLQVWDHRPAVVRAFKATQSLKGTDMPESYFEAITEAQVGPADVTFIKIGPIVRIHIYKTAQKSRRQIRNYKGPKFALRLVVRTEKVNAVRMSFEAFASRKFILDGKPATAVAQIYQYS